eukprot:tig00000767_g3958.t1
MFVYGGNLASVDDPATTSPIGLRPVMGDPSNFDTPMRSLYVNGRTRFRVGDGTEYTTPQGFTFADEAVQAANVVEGQQKSYVLALQNLTMGTTYSCTPALSHSSSSAGASIAVDEELSSGPASFTVPVYDPNNIPSSDPPPTAAADPEPPAPPSNDPIISEPEQTVVEGKQPPLCVKIEDPSQLLLWYRLNENELITTAEDQSGSQRTGTLAPGAAFVCKPPLIESVSADVERYQAKIVLNVLNPGTWTGFVYVNATCSAASLPEGLQLPPSTRTFGPRPFLLPPRKLVPISLEAAGLPPNSQLNCTVYLNMNDGPNVKVVAETYVQFQTGPVPPAPPLQPPPPRLMYYTTTSLIVQIGIQAELAWPPILKCDLYAMIGKIVVGHVVATELSTRSGRLVSVKGLEPSSDYTFMSRCSNNIEAGPLSPRVTFTTDGPPQEPFAPVRFAVSVDVNTKRATMEIGIPRPTIPRYFEVPADTFNCSIVFIEVNNQPIQGVGPTVKLEEFGDQQLVRRTIDSFAVGTSRRTLGVGRYKIAVSCANRLGRREGGWIPVDILNLEPPPSPGFTLAPRTFGANLWLDTMYLIPPGLEFCAGYIADAEVFRVTKADDMWCYKPFRTSDVETCGGKAARNSGVPAFISNLSPGTSYTLEVACSNANGRGQSKSQTLTTKDLPPPANLVVKQAESQYVTVYFDMRYGTGGGDPGTLNFTSADIASAPKNRTMTSVVSVLELEGLKTYAVQVACGRHEGRSNYTDPIIFTTRNSPVTLNSKTLKGIGSTLGKLAALKPLATGKDTCQSSAKSECIYKAPKDSTASQARDLKKEMCGESCEPGSNGKIKCTKDYPDYWTKPTCPAAQVSISSVMMPAKVAATRRRLQAGGAGASVGAGESTPGAECHDYNDNRGDAVKGNYVRVCTVDGKVVSSTYVLADANVHTNANGEVTSQIPDDLPTSGDLVPKGTRARSLLQTLSGPVFDNGAVLGMTTTAMQFKPRPVGLAAPTSPRVLGTTFRSVSIAFAVPLNEAYDISTSSSIPISKCSLLSLGTDANGAETAAEVASGLPPSRAAEMSLMADGLAPLTPYRLVATCSNTLGSSPRSTAVTVTTPAVGIQLNFDAIGRPAMDGSFVANAPLKSLPPMASAADRTACVPGTFYSAPRVEIGRFSGGAFADAITAEASLSPPIPEGSEAPSSSVCFVIPSSPFARPAASGAGRHLLALATNTAHAVRLTDAQTGSNVVIQNAVIWKPAGELDLNRTGLNCTLLGAIRSCASRSPRRLAAQTGAGSSSSTDFALAGTFAAVPTSVMVGTFDRATGAAVCAHPATNVNLCEAGLCFQLPPAAPAGCATGAGSATGRALLLASETTYDLRIVQADGEQVLISNFVQWTNTPAALSAWSQAQPAQSQSGGSGPSQVGLGLGIGLGLGAVLLLVGGIWAWNYYRIGRGGRGRRSRSGAAHAYGGPERVSVATFPDPFHNGRNPNGTTVNL